MTRRCELCGSERGYVLLKGRDWLHGQPGQANVCRCGECGLIYLWPRPATLLDSYPEEYAPHVGGHESADIAYSAGHQGGLMRKAQLVSQSKGGVLLDVGCAAGDFLAAVQNLDSRRLLGTDLSDRAVRRARQRFGIQAWVGTVPALPLPSASVGVVTLWHVFEHLPHPVAALRDIARILEPDGVLILACPMADSWEARLFGRYWAGYDVPRHLFAYSRQTLPPLLQRVGFEPSEVLHVVWSYNSARISSAFWLRRFSIFQQHPRLLRRTAALMGAVVALAFEGLSWIGGNRRAVAVFVARKRSNMEPD
jgi:ubiquinone/menaquinone biosynthesis C-methylase UbiE